MASIDTRRRVKHYVLNDARQWVDQGTGHVSWVYNDKQRSISLIVKSETDGSLLLEAKILFSIVYQRQQDTLIVWSDTDKRDLALSFQEKAGCDEIWEKICEVLGEDSSLSITSSRGVSSNGASSISNDNLDDSDEEPLDGEINASPLSDLPPCEFSKLKEIRDFFICELPRKTKKYKEKLSTIIETDNYIKNLLNIFHVCEDLENTEGLNYLYEIIRCLFYMNKSSLLDILLSDDLIMDVIGCLEYDPNKIVGMDGFVRHREFISTKSNFKEIIPFHNVDLVNKIHQTYKIQYIQDVILPAPSVFEENSLASLSSFIFLNKVEISNLIQEDERFLNELFENLKQTNLDVEKRRDMLHLLKEYTGFLHGIQQTREAFFKSLYDHGVLIVIEIALSTDDEKTKVIAIEILSHFVEALPTLVREFILTEAETKSSTLIIKKSTSHSPQSLSTSSNSNQLTTSSNNDLLQVPTTPVSNKTINNLDNVNKITENSFTDEKHTATTTPFIDSNRINHHHVTTTKSLADILNIDEVFEPVLMNYIVKQMINDPDVELSGAMQIVNLLKLLIDPENMLTAPNKAEKSEFLTYFYKKTMCVLLQPLMANTAGDQIIREDYRLAQLENLILDLLSFCVERHKYHMKNYIVNKGLLKRILVLLKSKHQFLALSALRFLRKTISLKEETYYNCIIKANLFEPIVEALRTNASRYNILNSAIVELFDFIRSDDIKPLMNYVVENFNLQLENINYVRTFKELKLRYDQHQEKLNDPAYRTRLEVNNANASLFNNRFRTSDYDRDEEAWIEDDFDEDEEHNANELATASNSNEENNQLESNHLDTFLEFKKASDDEAQNEDEYASVFSPVKQQQISTHNQSKSINIKINTTSLASNKSDDAMLSPKSDSSNSPTTPINSPLASRQKQALVDYESDSDEEENQERNDDEHQAVINNDHTKCDQVNNDTEKIENNMEHVNENDLNKEKAISNEETIAKNGDNHINDHQQQPEQQADNENNVHMNSNDHQEEKENGLVEENHLNVEQEEEEEINEQQSNEVDLVENNHHNHQTSEEQLTNNHINDFNNHETLESKLIATTNHINDENKSPLSPLSSTEPATKRARLSNS